VQPGPDSTPPPDRREFLGTSLHALGGAWLTMLLPEIERVGADARTAFLRQEPFRALTAAEARIAEAVAVAIFPDDGTPGAREAGVVHFIDRALDSFFGVMLPQVREGLALLDQRARDRGASGFAELAADARDAVLRDVETTPFFGTMRLLTIGGMFADPSYGGNRDGAGRRLLRIEHAAAYAPPFGYYDAEAAAAGGGAR
jgi:gluconate 2-dehydrogenase gamma chain